jgi:hypothetical protein
MSRGGGRHRPMFWASFSEIAYIILYLKATSNFFFGGRFIERRLELELEAVYFQRRHLLRKPYSEVAYNRSDLVFRSEFYSEATNISFGGSLYSEAVYD